MEKRKEKCDILFIKKHSYALRSAITFDEIEEAKIKSLTNKSAENRVQTRPLNQGPRSAFLEYNPDEKSPVKFEHQITQIYVWKIETLRKIFWNFF